MELVYVNDPEQIRKCTDMIWDMCQESYRPIGGFLSIKSKDDFAKRVNHLKLVLVELDDGTTGLGACGLYRFVNFGFKAIGYASNKNVADYRDCVKLIIEDDIAKYDSWYWVEASYAIAKWFGDLGGYAIPNVYVPEITGYKVTDDSLKDDGFKYIQQVGVGVNTQLVTKEMYGFANRETYDRIMKDYGDRGTFVKRVSEMKKAWKENPENKGKFESVLTEAARRAPDTVPTDINSCIIYVYNLDEFHVENDVYEVPPEWHECLEFSIKVLEKYYTEYQSRTVSEAIRVGKDLLGRVTPLELHRFPEMPDIKHSTL